jgi:toxin ParE1/3/4
MRYRVGFMPAAVDDLDRLQSHISERAGEVVAERYVARVHAFCMRLTDVPPRGTARDDIRPGLRTAGFERRATVAFVVMDPEVRIVRVLPRGLDVDARPREPAPK